jgi:hypothetical protein
LKHKKNLEQALAEFEASRLPVGARFVERGRQLGAYLQAHLATPSEREQAELHHTPECVMAETADLSFLTS